MGDKLMVLLMCEYAILLGVYAFEGNWGKVVYWTGAIIISLGVLMMKGK